MWFSLISQYKRRRAGTDADADGGADMSTDTLRFQKAQRISTAAVAVALAVTSSTSYDEAEGALSFSSCSGDPVDEGGPFYHTSPAWVIASQERTGLRREIFINVLQSPQLAHQHAVVAKYSTWRPARGTVPIVVHTVLLSTMTFAIAQGSCRGQDELVEALVRLVDMIYPEVRVDAAKVSVTALPCGMTPALLPPIERSLVPKDISLLFY